MLFINLIEVIMKRRFVYFMLFSAVFVISSCNNDAVISESITNESPCRYLQVSPDEEDALAELATTMHALNYQMVNDEYAMKKSFWSWLKKLWKPVVTIAADVVGTVAGGGNLLAGGVASSVVGAAFLGADVVVGANVGVTVPIHPRRIAFNGVVCPSTPENQTMNLSDSIGYYHNAILYDIMTDSCALSNCKTQQDLIDLVVQKMESVCADELGLDENERLQQIQLATNISSTLMDVLNSSNSFEEFMDGLKAKNIVSPAVIDVLQEYCIGLLSVNIEDNDGKYLQEILDKIRKSNLSATTKLAIGNACIVGNASNQLWIKE